MNAPPWFATLPPRLPVPAQDDAFDDSYAWVGYESAQPLIDPQAEDAVYAAESEA